MASCKECLHCDVCSAEKTCLPDSVNCKHFKDRNRFVELPATLGEGFFTIEQREGKNRVGYRFAEEITVCIVRGILNGRYTVLENCFNFKVKPHRKKIITDMSNIFQTYEEAEKALKERENNG